MRRKTDVSEHRMLLVEYDISSSVGFLNRRIRFLGGGLGGFKESFLFCYREIRAVAFKVVKLDIFGHLSKNTLIHLGKCQ
jgi:hypothetical protein